MDAVLLLIPPLSSLVFGLILAGGVSHGRARPVAMSNGSAVRPALPARPQLKSR